MLDWPTIDAGVNEVLQDTFGEQVVYQPVAAGEPVGSPLTIIGVRHRRPGDESGQVGNIEEISVNPADIPSYPTRGDWVTAWGTQFVVSNVRQPDASGLVPLVLMARSTS
jgi:hypothetical protein